MRVDLFDFDLPEDRIALRPLEPREAARLLVVDPAAAPALDDRHVRDLPALLRPGDALVINDTKVLPARLDGIRQRGAATARIEVNLHKREDGATWRAFVRPAKKLAAGETIAFAAKVGGGDALAARVLERHEAGEVVLGFDRSGAALDAALAEVGVMPLPPYIARRRTIDAQDASDYQTIFADRPGAVAAPTASLHFTPALVRAIEARGASFHRVTLHVGAGTFLAVKAATTEAHHMHAEWGEVDAATAAALNAARSKGGRIVAIGTTSLRLVESAAQPDGCVAPFRGDTSIFITPGYAVRAIDMLMTNFHLPRSTLFMLVSAFSGLAQMQAAYAHAVRTGYRFYSYGDACLLHRARETA
jgi:S-adenosylmethionine:tRNA ribosyltransferase-isomerase